MGEREPRRTICMPKKPVLLYTGQMDIFFAFIALEQMMQMPHFFKCVPKMIYRFDSSLINKKARVKNDSLV